MDAEFKLDATSQLLRKIVENSHEPRFVPELHLNKFNEINEAVHEFLILADGLEAVSTKLAAMPRPKLPPAVENALYNKLECSKRALKDIDFLALPYRSTQELEYPDEKDVPNLKFLKTVYPEHYKPEVSKRLLRVLIYTRPGEPALHSKWQAPNAELFHTSQYRMPSLRSWKHFWLYVAADKTYQNATSAVEMKNIGRILVLCFGGLSPDECPDLEKWELRAFESAQTFRGPEHPGDSSSLPPSSPLSPWASEFDYDYAPAAKRPLSPEPAQAESSKKRKVDAEQPVDAAAAVHIQQVHTPEPVHVRHPAGAAGAAQPVNGKQRAESNPCGVRAEDKPPTQVVPAGADPSTTLDSVVDAAHQVEAQQPAASIHPVVPARIRSSISPGVDLPTRRDTSVEVVGPMRRVDNQKQLRKQKQKSGGTAGDPIYVPSD